MNMLPRGGREAASRFFKADKVLWQVDEAKRAGYEERAAHSTADGGSTEKEEPAARG